MAWIGALVGGLLQLYAQDQAKKNQTTPTEVLKPSGQSQPAQNVFQQNVPSKSTPTPQGVEPRQFVPPSLVGATLAGVPDKDLGAIADSQVGRAPVPPQSATPTWQNVLASVPEAMAAIGPMLMQQQRQRSTIPVGAQGGGSGGQVVPGFGLPTQGMHRPTIGELLNSLPRVKYG